MRRPLTLSLIALAGLLVLPLLLDLATAAPAAAAPAPYRVSLELSRTTAFVNQTVTYRGSVYTASGGPAAGTVVIQRRAASGGSWVRWRTARLSSRGAYATTVRMTTKRSWRFRTRMPGNAAGASGYSPVCYLRVNGPTTAEAKVIRLVNAERTRRGLKPVLVRWSLTRAARSHASEMAQSGLLTHRSITGDTLGQRLLDFGYSRTGYRSWTVGETVARASAGTLSATPTAIVASWMRSSGHRRVILTSAFRDVGVGITCSASGMRYFTLDLGRRIR